MPLTRTMEKLILVTNDDGIDAPGIKFLISFLRPLGRIVVVAPQTGMSGMGHAVTISTPLRIKQLASENGIDKYKTNGTPADCVKLALNQILDKKPDLIVSGINHGSNHSINILYSGTMAAAIEGAMQNIPAIGFSMFNYDTKLDFSFAGTYIKQICQNTLESGLPAGTCLNVNFPDNSSPKGIKICRQSIGFWDEGFEKRIDLHQKPYYWLKGEFIVPDQSSNTDDYALKNGYISIVPVTIDLTAHQNIESLKKTYNDI